MFFKNHKNSIMCGITMVVAIFMCLIGVHMCSKLKKAKKIEYTDSICVHHVKYNDGKFSDLKKENEQLYDSLKKYKKQIDYLVQFTYEKTYTTNKVVIKKESDAQKTYTKNQDGNLVENIDEAKTYEYSNEPNDSINYQLKINSTREPNWYSLDVKMHDRITIVNKNEGNGDNHLTISTDNKAEISNTTVFKKKRKKNIFNKIAIVPGIYYGYDIKNKSIGYGVAVTIGYNIFGTK